MLRGCSSRVHAFGHLSSSFLIQQGTRQGSIWTPFLYTVLFDGLLKQLVDSKFGLKINDVSLCAPTQADDIVLMSLTKNGLNELLKLCNDYANKWRFSYNASKCAILVHNQTSRQKSVEKTIKYAGQPLPEVKVYKHVGINQCTSRTTPANVDDIRQSARGSLFSLINCGVHSNGINPISASKLYTSIVLPRALYGCELWNGITKSNIAHLEATHHFCLKRLQSLPLRTRSDMVKGLLGFTSLEAYIDLQKLLFMGTLCRLKPRDVTYKLFVLRLFHLQNKCTRLNRGFINDIVRILEKYGLNQYLNDFISTCTFPPKCQWKRLCKSTIFALDQSNWRARLETSDDFFRFREVHLQLTSSNIWLTALKNPNSVETMTFLAQL